MRLPIPERPQISVDWAVPRFPITKGDYGKSNALNNHNRDADVKIIIINNCEELKSDENDATIVRAIDNCVTIGNANNNTEWQYHFTENLQLS